MCAGWDPFQKIMKWSQADKPVIRIGLWRLSLLCGTNLAYNKEC